MEFAALAEFIGFDIIFIGILTVLATRAGMRLWKEWSSPFGLCKGAIRDCENLFGEPEKQNESAKQEESGKKAKLGKQTKSAKTVVGVLVLAAVAGMIANFVADQLLDSGLLQGVHLPQLERKTKSQTKPAPHPEAKSKISPKPKSLRAEEDWIKAWVLCDVCGVFDKSDSKKPEAKILAEPLRTSCAAVEAKLAEETKRAGKSPEEPIDLVKVAKDEAKDFFRAAQANFLQWGSGSLVGSLQSELLVVRVFRVLFLYSVVLMFVSCVTVASAGWRKPEQKQTLRSLLTAVVFIFAAYFCLWCWGYQSKRYYRKLGQASVAVSSYQKSGRVSPTLL